MTLIPILPRKFPTVIFKMLKKQMITSDRSADAVLVGMVKSSRVKLGNNFTRVLSRF